MQHLKVKRVFLISALAFLSLLASARGPQEHDFLPAGTDSLKAVADSLYTNFDFAAAAAAYRQAQIGLDSAGRAAIEDRITACVNGENLAAFCFKPVAIARERFCKDDFFLFYPLPDSSWHSSSRDSSAVAGGIDLGSLFYLPSEAGICAWSAADSSGLHRLHYREKKDSLWGADKTIDLPASCDAILPMPCGDRLYFSAKGLYGVGGYDLYVCSRQQDGSWGEPANMGFPFSSQADDFLFADSEDGKYSLFASTRGCSADSISVYVIKYDAMPVRSSVEGASGLAELCAMTPEGTRKKIDTGSAMSAAGDKDGSSARYTAKIAEVRRIRDSIAVHNRQLDAMRARYSGATGAEKDFLSGEIASMEAALPSLQAKLSKANSELRSMEMEFLRHGVLIDPAKVAAEADKEVVGASSSFTFSRKSFARKTAQDSSTRH